MEIYNIPLILGLGLSIVYHFRQQCHVLALNIG